MCLPSDFQARCPCNSGTLCPPPTLDGRLGTKVIACSKLHLTPWMIQAGSLFALRGLGQAQKKELCIPFKPIFISSPTGFSSPTSGALHSEGKIHFPARCRCRPNQVAAKAETMAQSGVILIPSILVVGQPLLPILSIIFVVLLRQCVVLCLFVVLACCVQSRKPGVTIWELPDPTHLENKPIGRRCSPLPEERERVCSWECILINLY